MNNKCAVNTPGALLGAYVALLFTLMSMSMSVHAATETSINLAQQMYVAYYGRPADPEGLDYWAARFEGVDDLESVLGAFGSSQEYYDNFSQLSNVDLVNNLFQQMFSRNSDPEGAAFYVTRLEAGEATVVSIAKQIADGRQNEDRDRLNNKVVVANALTRHIKEEGVTYTLLEIEVSRALLATVTEYQDSIIQGLYVVDNFGIDSEYAAIQCSAPRPEVCTEEYAPVCATRDTGVRCITTPCPSTEKASYSNACSACADSSVFYYKPEECAL
jgi:hypothetical protein